MTFRHPVHFASLSLKTAANRFLHIMVIIHALAFDMGGITAMRDRLQGREHFQAENSLQTDHCVNSATRFVPKMKSLIKFLYLHVIRLSGHNVWIIGGYFPKVISTAVSHINTISAMRFMCIT